MFLYKNGVDILQERGFLETDINCVFSEFKKILLDRNKKYLNYIKNEGEAIIE